MPAAVYVVSIDPQASTVWWANRITNLPFDFSQEHETPENLAILKDTGARVHVIANQKGGCLLYTSPSPRDLSTSRMPSSA